jgi:predicted nucleic acid-binding protein
MEQYLIDNNVISNYFSGAFSEKAMNFLSEVICETPILSVITKIEALSWRNTDIAKENIVRLFVDFSNVIALSDMIVDECIAIRRNRKMKTPDAIIAATAIVYDFTLLTSDADFNRIPNLRILNPFNL